jgi:hypothetical protein
MGKAEGLRYRRREGGEETEGRSKRTKIERERQRLRNREEIGGRGRGEET